MVLRPRRHRPPEAVGHRPRRRRAANAGLPPRLGQGRARGRGREPGRADLQRRGLQLHRAPQRADAPRAPLPDALGHRGRASGLPAVGCRLRHPPERHVRVRHLGRAPPGAAAGPGPARRKAAVLRAAAGRRALRFRAQGDPGAPRLPRRDRRRRPGRAVRPGRHRNAGPRRVPWAVPGKARHDRPGRPLRPKDVGVLDARGARAHRRPRRHGLEGSRAAGRHRAPPDRRRRAAVQPAVRRPRLERRLRAGGRQPDAARPDQAGHVLGRLRRQRRRVHPGPAPSKPRRAVRACRRRAHRQQARHRPADRR